MITSYQNGRSPRNYFHCLAKLHRPSHPPAAHKDQAVSNGWLRPGNLTILRPIPRNLHSRRAYEHFKVTYHEPDLCFSATSCQQNVQPTIQAEVAAAAAATIAALPTGTPNPTYTPQPTWTPRPTEPPASTTLTARPTYTPNPTYTAVATEVAAATATPASSGPVVANANAAHSPACRPTASPRNATILAAAKTNSIVGSDDLVAQFVGRIRWVSGDFNHPWFPRLQPVNSNI